MTYFQDEEASLRQEVEKLLRCPVCKEIVTDPKMLPCGEFSCSECIKLLRGEWESGRAGKEGVKEGRQARRREETEARWEGAREGEAWREWGRAGRQGGKASRQGGREQHRRK